MENTAPLTNSQKQARRVAELDAIAQAAGWPNWGKYATAVKNRIVSIAQNPAASRANPIKDGAVGRKGRTRKQTQ